MSYRLTLTDDSATKSFNLLEIPIIDKDIEGVADNTVLTGDVFTDYMYLKKQYEQSWLQMTANDYADLRGFYTRQWTNAKYPHLTIEDMDVYEPYVIYEERVASGDYILISGQEAPSTLSVTRLNGNTTQTTYTGKNLFNFKEFTDYIGVNGVTRGTATYTDNSITITATSADCFTKYGFPSIPPVIHVAQNTNMVLSWKTNTTGTSKGRIYIFGNDNGSSVVIGSGSTPDTNELRTFNTGNYTEITFRLGVTESGDSITYSDIQLEVGSTATAFEPYVGGIPSPNPDYPQPVETVTGAQNVVVSGENLLPPTEDWTQTINGVTIKVEGGVYTFSGTATSGGTSDTWKSTIAPYTIRAGDYYHLGNEFANSQIQINIYFTDGTMQNASFTTLRRMYDLSPHVGKTISQLCIYWNANNTFNGVAKPMILHNVSTQTDFVPYQGQDYEINLGKNILKPYSFSKTQNGVTFNYTSTGVLSLSGTATTTAWLVTTVDVGTAQKIELSPGTYSLSVEGRGTQSGITVRLDDSDTAEVIASTTGSEKTFVVTSFIKQAYLQVRIASGTAITPISMRVQLERGASPTAYASYFEPIELAKIGDYQDYIWNDGGTWKLHKETAVAVLDGSEQWSESGSTHQRFLIGNAQPTFILLARGTPSYKSKCDYFTFQEGSTAWTGVGKCGFDSTGTFWCMISGMSSLSDFKTWLGANNVRVYYPLATATDTEITNSTLLEQLNHVYELYVGDNNIMLIPSETGQGEIEVVYYKTTIGTRPSRIVDTQAVRLKLTDGGVIDSCGSRQNVKITMRQTEND